jgi:hypothetical protein
MHIAEELVAEVAVADVAVADVAVADVAGTAGVSRQYAPAVIDLRGRSQLPPIQQVLADPSGRRARRLRRIGRSVAALCVAMAAAVGLSLDATRLAPVGNALFESVGAPSAAVPQAIAVSVLLLGPLTARAATPTPAQTKILPQNAGSR